VNEPNLLVVCLAAFVSVMLLLSALAGIIRLLMAVFPGETQEAGIEPAVVAAIHSAVAAAYPGTRVTAVEEVK
jgi:hypothetical protein